MEKRPFYLFKRKLAKGSMYYYYFYDEFGHRSVPLSTGCTTKTEAMTYCCNLFRRNNLQNNKTKFKSYAKDFFEPHSIWSKDKELQDAVTKGTVKGYKSYFENHVYSYFAEMYVDKITPTIVKQFRVYLADEKDLANKTINNIVSVLGIVLSQAEEENYIFKNPVNSIKKLPRDSEREAFTEKQVLDIINNNNWTHYPSRLFTIVGAVTGMRFSEILGLQPDSLHDDYIEINRQYYDGELTDTKTGDNRFVTCPPRLIKLLRDFCQGEYIFTSPDDCTKPYSRSVIVRHFYNAYPNYLVEDREEKLMTFHSLRHFANTYFISNYIPETKVNFVIGHSTGKDSMMTLYTSWKPDMYKDLLHLQEQLLDKFNLK